MEHHRNGRGEFSLKLGPGADGVRRWSAWVGNCGRGDRGLARRAHSAIEIARTEPRIAEGQLHIGWAPQRCCWRGMSFNVRPAILENWAAL